MIEAFRRLFDSTDDLHVYRAPGRVNVIGEHTDYNLGFVLPVALDMATFVATAPATDGKLRLHSEQRGETREFDVAHLDELAPQHDWTDYPIGVALQVAKLGFPIHPAHILIRSTVPEGSGLSSSAALEVSTALGFLNGREVAPLELAKLCQRAEHEFLGMPCGIMDQYISVFGRQHCAVKIDCRSLDHQLVTLPDSVTFVAVNTMVKHALAGSAYRDRVAECAAAVAALQPDFPSARSLRDIATLDQFESAAHLLPPVVARRARHVVGEDERVEQFVAASARGDLDAMGKLMVASHRSLQYDYEVSCVELDYLVDQALSIDGVYGSRMTGGGFGGCTVTMLRPAAVAAFSDTVARAYERRFQVTPRVYRCIPSAGAGPCISFETIPPVG